MGILTPEEQRIIAAFPEALVKRIPRGTFGEATAYTASLVTDGPKGWNQPVSVQSKVAAAALRRKRVLAMALEGATTAEMAAATGFSRCTVRADLIWLRAKGKPLADRQPGRRG